MDFNFASIKTLNYIKETDLRHFEECRFLLTLMNEDTTRMDKFISLKKEMLEKE